MSTARSTCCSRARRSASISTRPCPVRCLPADPLGRARQRAWVEFASGILSDIAGLYNAADAAAFAAKRQVLDRSLPGTGSKSARAVVRRRRVRLGRCGISDRYFAISMRSSGWPACHLAEGLPKVSDMASRTRCPAIGCERRRCGLPRQARALSAGTGFASLDARRDQPARIRNVASTAAPYRASLDAPTPLIWASASSVAGHAAAISRSVVSWKMT